MAQAPFYTGRYGGASLPAPQPESFSSLALRRRPFASERPKSLRRRPVLASWRPARSETKPGRRRSAPGPENQIPIPSRPAFRRAFKARINKGEALGNQHDRASGLNLTVAAVIARDTIYLGNAVASFRNAAHGVYLSKLEAPAARIV